MFDKQHAFLLLFFKKTVSDVQLLTRTESTTANINMQT